MGEGSSHGILHPILRTPSPEPIPIPPPMPRPSSGKVTKDLHQAFAEGWEMFLSGGGVLWLDAQLEGSPPPYAGGRGIGYVSESDVDTFLDHVVGSV